MSASLYQSARSIAVCVVFLAAACAWADDAAPPAPTADESPSWSDRIDFSALLRLEWAQEFRDGDGQKLEIQYDPELQIELPRDLRLTLIGRLTIEPIDRFEPGNPSQAAVDPFSRRWELGDYTDIELREAYFDAKIGDAHLRVGKQQIVWGKADGLKVLDVVNPQDYREFVLDDYDDSRIPQWALNVEIPINDVSAQFLWIPDTSTHRIPERGSAYDIRAGLPKERPGLRLDIQEPDRPNRFIQDSDVGMRLSTFYEGWDLTFNYLYHYDDVPLPERKIKLFRIPPTVVVTPSYDRTHLVGGTFSNAFGNLTVRGELGYSFGKMYSTDKILDSDGLVETDEFAYVLGFDWFGFKDTFVSVQLFQSILMSAPDQITRHRTDTNITFNVKRSFRNDTLHLETIWIHNLTNNDGLVRPKISYSVRDNVTVWTGVDYFYGTEKGVFGEFDARDRFVLGMEIGF